MSLSLNKPKLDNLAGDIWKSAERLRGKFKTYEYQGVILPIIVIRRLECVLLAWREAKRAEVLARRPKLTEKELAKLVKELELNPKQSPFSNKTGWTLRKVYEEDHALLEENFRAYINGFSKNVDDIIEHFNYRATIGTMVKNNRLAPILNQYKELELGPDQLSGLEMGYIYEELLRRFSEQSGEEAGEHFTPREVIRLMVELLEIPIPDRHFSIYDPAGGTGGMLSVSKEHLLDRAATPEEKDRVEKFVTVHGQELSRTNYAICQADLLLKNDQQAKVFLGNSLIPHDPHSKEPGDQLPEPKYRFNRMLSNPPFGVTWGGKDGYETEARKLEKTRYQAGMPRMNDGALLFLETMLIDARQQFEKEPKSFGNKRNRITDSHRAWIEERYRDGWAKGYSNPHVKIFKNTARGKDFAYHKVSVVFWQTDEHGQPAIVTERYDKAFTAANVRKEQEFYASELRFTVRLTAPIQHGDATGRTATIHLTLGPDDDFPKLFEPAASEAFRPELDAITSKLNDSSAKKKAAKKFLDALAAEVEWTHRHYVQDDEYIPHGEDIEAFLKREIAKPIIRWEDSSQLGYEILPNKYFYHYQPPTPAKDLLAEFWKLEKEAEKMLEGLAMDR